MESLPAVAVPLRTGKKMKKRKELDALVANTSSKRTSGVSSHEQLLTDSSDEWTGGGAGGGVASARCRRRVAARRRACFFITRAFCVLLVLSCAIATTTVMWLFIDVRQQITLLRTDLNQVVAAHEGVPDALHACHSLSRELHKNQSDMNTRLVQMSAAQQNLTLNLTRVQNALSAVQQQLNASPGLVNDPRLVNDLSKQVAEFGSKIQDLQTTVANLKEHDSRLDGTLQVVGSNVTDLHVQVAGLVADRGGVSAAQLAEVKTNLLQLVNGLSANVTTLNETLTSKLNWTDQDQFRDHKTVVSLQEMDQNITARLRTLEEMMIKKTTPVAEAKVVGLTEQGPTPVMMSSSAAAAPPPQATPAQSNIPLPLLDEKTLNRRP